MQPETRQVHICDGLRRVEPGENIAQLHHMLGQHAARVVVFVKAFQSPGSFKTVMRYITDVN